MFVSILFLQIVQWLRHYNERSWVVTIIWSGHHTLMGDILVSCSDKHDRDVYHSEDKSQYASDPRWTDGHRDNTSNTITWSINIWFKRDKDSLLVCAIDSGWVGHELLIEWSIFGDILWVSEGNLRCQTTLTLSLKYYISAHIKHDKDKRFPSPRRCWKCPFFAFMRHPKLLRIEENICPGLSNNIMLDVKIFYLIM